MGGNQSWDDSRTGAKAQPGSGSGILGEAFSATEAQTCRWLQRLGDLKASRDRKSGFFMIGNREYSM